MTSKTPSVILALSIILSIATANADGWKHSCMTSTSSAKISVDFAHSNTPYNDVGGPAGDIASPVWVNVEGGGLGSDAQLAVLISNYAYDRRLGNYNDQARKLSVQSGNPIQIRLQVVAGSSPARFTAQLPSPIVIGDVGSEYPGSNYFQTIQSPSSTADGGEHSLTRSAEAISLNSR